MSVIHDSLRTSGVNATERGGSHGDSGRGECELGVLASGSDSGINADIIAKCLRARQSIPDLSSRTACWSTTQLTYVALALSISSAV